MRKIIAAALVFSFACSVFIMFYQINQRFFPGAFRNKVFYYSEKHKLDPLWVAAMISVESSFNPVAVSKSGAIGLMQLMPATAEELAYRSGVKDFSKELLNDPAFNLDIGCKYYSKLMKRYAQDRDMALIAYNAGPSNLDRWRKDSDGSLKKILSRAYPETQKHVKKVNRIYKILRIIKIFNPDY